MMNFRDDWPLMAVFLMMFLIIGGLLASAFISAGKYADYSARCEKAGGVPINDNGDYFCVEKFADMRTQP